MTRIFVFLVFRRRPFFSLASFTRQRRSISSFLLLHISVVSSAYLKAVILSPPKRTHPLNTCSASLMMYSEYTLKRLGDRIHSCWSPLPMVNHSVLPTPVLTADSWSLYWPNLLDVLEIQFLSWSSTFHYGLHSQMTLSSWWNTDTDIRLNTAAYIRIMGCHAINFLFNLTYPFFPDVFRIWLLHAVMTIWSLVVWYYFFYVIHGLIICSFGGYFTNCIVIYDWNWGVDN